LTAGFLAADFFAAGFLVVGFFFFSTILTSLVNKNPFIQTGTKGFLRGTTLVTSKMMNVTQAYDNGQPRR
jgi:hypothetical protein